MVDDSDEYLPSPESAEEIRRGNALDNLRKIFNESGNILKFAQALNLLLKENPDVRGLSKEVTPQEIFCSTLETAATRKRIRLGKGTLEAMNASLRHSIQKHKGIPQPAGTIIQDAMADWAALYPNEEAIPNPKWVDRFAVLRQKEPKIRSTMGGKSNNTTQWLWIEG